MGKVISHKYSIRDYFDKFSKQLNDGDFLSAKMSLDRMNECNEGVDLTNLYADLYFEMGEYNECVKYLGKIIDNSKPMLGHIYNILAACFYFKGNYIAASNYFHKQVALNDGEDYRFDYLIPKLADKLKSVDRDLTAEDFLPPMDDDLTDEELDYDVGLELTHSDCEKYIRIAYFNHCNEDDSRALKLLKKALKAVDVTDEQKLKIIYLLYRIGKKSQIKSLKLDDFYYSLHKEDFETLLFLKASIAILDNKQLIELCKDNLKENNAHSWSYLILGQCLFNDGKYDEGIEAMRKATLTNTSIIPLCYYEDAKLRKNENKEAFQIDVDLPFYKIEEFKDTLDCAFDDDLDEDMLGGEQCFYGSVLDAYNYFIEMENNPYQDQAVMALGLYSDFTLTQVMLEDALLSPIVSDVNKYAIFTILIQEPRFQKDEILILRNNEFMKQYIFRYKGTPFENDEFFTNIFNEVQEKLYLSFELTKKVKKVFVYMYNFIKNNKIAVKKDCDLLIAYIYMLCSKNSKESEIYDLFGIEKDGFNKFKSKFTDKGFDKKNIK